MAKRHFSLQQDKVPLERLKL